MTPAAPAGDAAVIEDVRCVAGDAGFFFDDQMAIRHGAVHDGFDYTGTPVTPGFARVRQPGRCLSVALVLDDGQVAVGDCAAVQYAGAGGRDPLFDPVAVATMVDSVVAPLLRGAGAGRWRPLMEAVASLRWDGGVLPASVRYGVSQAVLGAVAAASHTTMAEVVRDEYATGSALAPVAVFAQSGDERWANVDKMILKGVDVLPHGLINNVDDKLGADGGIFEDYVRWVRDRVFELRQDAGYHPVLHFDTYATIGLAFGADTARMAAYLERLEAVAAPLQLRIEHPVDGGSRAGQIDALGALRQELARRGCGVQLVADEWCNSLDDIEAFVAAAAADVIHVKTPDLGSLTDTAEALLHVRRHGLLAYSGGTCNETVRSAQASTHVAMACDADQVLAKPGMGVDEGLMVVRNEMALVGALAGSR